MRRIALNEAMFEGWISLERNGESFKPWRLPHEQAKLFPSVEDRLLMRAEQTTGVRLRFSTDAIAIALTVEPYAEPRKFDLTAGERIVASAPLAAGESQVLFGALPAGRKIVEIWLAHDQLTVVRGLAVNDGATVEPAEDSRPRWVAYGSSITQCRSAHSPARTWPAIAARKRGLNLTCLGFGGECHVDTMIARLIRDLPADLVTLKLGINTHVGSFSIRTFKPAAIGYVRIIREKHPDLPLAVISPIVSPPREDERGSPSGLTLQEMRLELADAVERLRACGDRNIRYFDGRELFGADLAEKYMPDQLHPDGDGYEIMGENFCRVVLDAMGIPPAG